MTDSTAAALHAGAKGLIPTMIDASRLQGLVEQRWPQVRMNGAAFGAFLERHAIEGQGLGALHLEDLYLAWGCLDGQQPAISTFESYTRPFITLAVRRGTADSEEIVHQVHIKLLVAEGTRQPRLADYSGVGPLKAFVMVMAMRVMADTRRGVERRREELVGDGWLELASIAGSTNGQDAKVQWAELEPHAAKALSDAMGQLSVRQRTLLRLHYVEGISADAIGKMYSVHRATTTRWLVDARERLLELVQSQLKSTLEVGTGSLESINRTLVGGLELSLPALLETKADRGRDPEG